MNRYMRSMGTSNSLQTHIPMSEDQMHRVAPSVFQTEPHESRSDRYTYIPTSRVLESLKNEGWAPFYACQARTRIPGKSEFTKHMIRLRRHDAIEEEDTNELILLNSHDGTSSYRMIAGVFRFVCSNGLMVGDVCNDVTVHHKGNIVNEVIEGSYRILDDFDKVNEHREEMKQIILPEPAQRAFAKASLELRWDGHKPIEPEQVIKPRRTDDIKPDLWSTFNKAQENLIRGGMRGRSEKGKLSRVRAVQGIDKNTAINRGLWTLAEEMKNLMH